MFLRLTVAISATVAALAVQSAPDAKGGKTSAVDKAIELMETLRATVAKEGEEEAKTYDNFACFCKDTTSDRLEAIKKGEDERGALVATINSLTSRRDGLDTESGDIEKAIEDLDKEIKKAKRERKAAFKEYEVNAGDLSGALSGLDTAIGSLKGSKSPSLVEMRAAAQTARSASELADALGFGSHGSPAALALIQQPDNEVPMEDYKFHSGDIIKMLEGLRQNFLKMKNEVDDDEVKAKQEYDLLMQDKTHDRKTKNQAMARAGKKKSETVGEIGMNSEELSTQEANLLQDKEYTKQLSKMCSDKAITWDQRSRTRADELATLTEAIGMIKGSVKSKTGNNTVRLSQQGATVRVARAIAASEGAMDAIEAAAEEADSAPSLVQVALQRRGSLRASDGKQLSRPSAPDGREAVAKALKGSGEQLKSTLLTALASRIAADPLAKVKTLIQELIERLLQEAANEANQKGWCDKAMGDAKQKRDTAAEDIADLNSQLAIAEATMDQLAEDLPQLTEEIASLTKSQEDANKERESEKAENKAVLKEADEGLDALNMCIKLLDTFYKSMKKETVDLSLAQGPADDMPDAGFEAGEAYTGAEAEAGGIMGLLDVMKSDFERTLVETRKAEKKAAKEHLEFMTESGMALAEKTEAKKAKSSQKSDLEEQHSTNSERLKARQSSLASSIKELVELQGTCNAPPMSYEERVARREDEINSLKKAYCIFEKYAESGSAAVSEC